MTLDSPGHLQKLDNVLWTWCRLNLNSVLFWSEAKYVKISRVITLPELILKAKFLLQVCIYFDFKFWQSTYQHFFSSEQSNNTDNHEMIGSYRLTLHHCVITGHSSKMTWWQMFWWEDIQGLSAMRALPLQTPSCAGSWICWQPPGILLVQPLVFQWSPLLEDTFTFYVFSWRFQKRTNSSVSFVFCCSLSNNHETLEKAWGWPKGWNMDQRHLSRYDEISFCFVSLTWNRRHLRN